MPYCPSCGSETEADAAFCGSCGARLEGELPPSLPRPRPRQGPNWAIPGGLAALIALVVGGVLVHNALTGDGEGQERQPGGGEEQGVVMGASPTAPAEPTLIATAEPAAEPTTTAKPTAAPQPTLPLAATAVPPTPGYATPEEAIDAYLEQYGVLYAGDCALADLETDIGSYCSMMWEDRGNELIYVAGLVFSEADVWLLVADQGGGWLVVDDAELLPGTEELVPPWP
jgi:hypothetical protein